MLLYNTEVRHLLGGLESCAGLCGFRPRSRFYLHVLDGEQVITDLDGIDFADLDTVIAKAVAGARDLVAHRIVPNEHRPFVEDACPAFILMSASGRGSSRMRREWSSPTSTPSSGSRSVSREHWARLAAEGACPQSHNQGS